MVALFSDGSFTVFTLHILVFGILFAVVLDAFCSYTVRKRLRLRLAQLEQERADMKKWSIYIYDYLQNLRVQE